MKLVYSHNAQTHTLDVTRAGDEFEITVNGEHARVQVISFAPPRLAFLYNGKIVTARVASDGQKRWIHMDGATLVLERAEPNTARAQTHGAREGTGSGIVIAPMPGQVRAVLVQEGDAVTAGQPLALLEAMKMELKVSAPHDGIVSKIYVTQGQSVEREQILTEVTKRGG
jgi:biotin carboxyl carrier protein